MEKDREGISGQKIQHFLAVLAGKARSADAYLDSFSHFHVEFLRGLTQKRIESLLLDVDGCIAPAYREILPENIAHIRTLIAKDVGIGIYSNCKNMPRLDPLDDMGIPIYGGDLPKPNPQGFLNVCEEFGFNPESTWMVGDNPNTDGGAVGVLGGMALIKPIPSNPEGWPLGKRVKVGVMNMIRSVALAATLTRNKKIIRSRNLLAG